MSKIIDFRREGSQKQGNPHFKTKSQKFQILGSILDVFCGFEASGWLCGPDPGCWLPGRQLAGWLPWLLAWLAVSQES